MHLVRSHEVEKMSSDCNAVSVAASGDRVMNFFKSSESGEALWIIKVYTEVFSES